MKKRPLTFIVVITLCILMTGCVNKEAQLEERIHALNNKITQLRAEKDVLQNEITYIKVESGTAKYIVTFNIKQSHFTLDIEQHLKDAMNEITIQIPVDKEYYDSLEIGDTIADDFRIGSLIMKGSFGNWEITVKDKEIQ